MSYILNALRKSEQERQSIPAQTIESSILEPVETLDQRSRWPIVIGVLVVVNVIALTYFINDKTPESRDAVSTQAQSNTVTHKPEQLAKIPEPKLPRKVSSDPASKPPSTQPASKKTVVPPKPVAQTPNTNVKAKTNESKAPAKVATKTPTIKPVITKKPTEQAIKPAIEPMQLAKTEKAAPTPVITAVPPKPIQSKPEQKTQTNTLEKTPPATNKTPAKPAAKTEPPKIQPAPTTQEIIAEKTPKTKPTPVVTKKVEPEYPLLKKLPYEFRRTVPKLNINVFVYSDDPKQCFVIIDMLKYQAGQLLPGSIKLKEIRNDSLVVNYKNRTFRIKRP